MIDKLRSVLHGMNEMESACAVRNPSEEPDARAAFLVTLVFLVCMLSVPLSGLSQLLLFFIFPILMSSRAGLGYGTVFRRSLVVLPFVALIGIFNPVYDRQPAFAVGNLIVTDGWVSFLSIVLRGLLSVQAVIVLVRMTGYYRLCGAMERLGVPSVFTSQLLMVYRYAYVLVEEALCMVQAREARSFGRRSYPLKIYGAMTGQLLVRSMHRAQQIHGAMLARGFDGRIPQPACRMQRWRGRDTVFLAAWSVVLVALRVWHPVEKLAVIFQ